jgi:hypothetical protein
MKQSSKEALDACACIGSTYALLVNISISSDGITKYFRDIFHHFCVYADYCLKKLTGLENMVVSEEGYV